MTFTEYLRILIPANNVWSADEVIAYATLIHIGFDGSTCRGYFAHPHGHAAVR